MTKITKEFIIAVAFLLVVGGGVAGYVYLGAQNTKDTPDVTVSVPKQPTTSEDLKAQETSLKDLDSTDTELNAIETDINSLDQELDTKSLEVL